TASGRLINPQKFRPLHSDSAQPNATAETAAKIVEELRALQFPDTPPQIDLRFSGDLAEPEKVFVEVALHAGQVKYRNVHLDALPLEATYRDGRVEARRLVASDALGTLTASGEYDVPAKTAALHLQSTLDPAPFARLVLADSPALEDLTFQGPPSLGFTA